MRLSQDDIRRYVQRLLLSRMRLLHNHSFYGLLLMHMKFAVDEALDTACTDGERIIFGTEFLEELSDDELDFVMMHEILHVALRHCFRGQDLNHTAFNIACDIVVNSLILAENGDKAESITLGACGEAMHRTPMGEEGRDYTAEQVYAMLDVVENPGDGQGDQGDGSGQGNQGSGWRDDHSRWQEALSRDPLLAELWEQRVRNTCEIISIRESSSNAGEGSLLAQRLLKQMNSQQVDWRLVLQDFVQKDKTDYSFEPPDRRYSESPFFLPDLNADGDSGRIENIWFVVDTSGSVSDNELAAAFAELRSAIQQFDGQLAGILSFMEWVVTEPVPFEGLEELEQIKPVGGGGTSFAAIFDYLAKYMADELPACIVIITDGYCRFPDKAAALGVPVLWLITNDEVDPPWGKIARIKV